MAYPERKPIYGAYKEIVQKIIEERQYKDYAEAEIDDLINSITAAFKEIKNQMINQKNWPKTKS